MAPTIVMAARHVQLENCAAWHTDRSELLHREARSKTGSAYERLYQEAERHDLIAFRLFREAHWLRSQKTSQAA